MKVVSIEKSPELRLLLYGDSGVGKTYFIGSAMKCEETCPVLVLSCRGQPVSLRNFDPPPLVIEVETMKDFNEPYLWFARGQPLGVKGTFIEAAKAYLDEHGFERFKTLAIDSITGAQRIALRGIVDAGGVLPGDMPQQARIQHWGDALRQIVNLVDLFYKLPIHLVITALAKWTTLEGVGTTMFSPFLWGQSSLEVPSHAEIVGRLIALESLDARKANVLSTRMPREWAGAYNLVQLRAGRNFFAKWQGLLEPPEFILAPTMTKLIEAFQAG